MLERAAWEEEEEEVAEAVVAVAAVAPLSLILDADLVIALIAFSFHLSRFRDSVQQPFHLEALMDLQEHFLS